MATLHAPHHRLRLSRDTVSHCHVLLVESESQARFLVSCVFADYTRLKCNRGQPCEHCVKREDAISCSYATNADLNTTGAANSSNKTQHTEDQLHRLEHLVAEAIKLHRGKTQSPVRGIVPFIAGHR